ncbi:BHLH domain-containing protein [Caenorhabditis elegans]|uniref:BHLH domain-containing protein n=1 Tax=Caenorhabditis elegans TaxID=6239 RepID=Q20941_CAEEL|nr:BHLH domain-containing protein [Caenorhabditis elegans]CCD69447.1 BHLH domain-containing protein [Caenorhabditis elegans]|eukprot:NP_508119.2 Helix Loop Helix [Caenorhabditis elegans]
MSRERANARERCRQKSIGNAFNMLRNHLPKQLRDRKPSKAETLKSAAQYISHLLRILEKEIENSSNNLKDEHQKDPSLTTPSHLNSKIEVCYAHQNGEWVPPECHFVVNYD